MYLKDVALKTVKIVSKKEQKHMRGGTSNGIVVPDLTIM